MILENGLSSQPVRRRIVRRILTDANGRQVIIEEVENIPSRPQFMSIFSFEPFEQSNQQFNELFPLFAGLSPLDFNFRSSVNDNLLEQILRLSM
jgi:hypothetical protein